MNANEQLSFSGHETFPFRYAWPKKAVEHAHTDAYAFGAEDALVRFGVGKNMVSSIRHWGLALGLLETAPASRSGRARPLRPTALGRSLLLGDESWDPYLEDPGTLWLLHWRLASRPDRATTWWWVFNQHPGTIFTRVELVEMQDHPLLDDDFEYGLLKFDGKQEYFALDGQHRLRSIKDAIDKNPDLRHEEVSVVFVTHERTEEGNIKTRRLFHTLNRYARPTTTGENIALDEDNVVSISTRMLLNSGMQTFSARYMELVRKNLTSTQREKFTSLAALYDFNLSVLEAMYSFKKDYLRYRPDASHVEHVFSAISSLWIEIRKRFDEFGTLETEMNSPGEIREPNGDPSQGHLLFRPLGLRIYGQVLAHALHEEESLPAAAGSEVDPGIWQRALDRVSALPLTLGSLPWRGTIFRNNKMETGARNLAVRLACYMLGLGQIDSTKLLEDYRGHLDDESAELPSLKIT